MQHPPGQPAVFLDRDGTLVEEVDYLVDPGQLRLIPGAAAAVRRLNEAGLPVILVTNQSMIARGMASETQLAAVHDRLTALLLAEGARLDRIYYCPHHPDIGQPPYRGVCECRKPLPGLLHQAARELSLDLSRSAMIGDSLRDMEAGNAAGCATLILVRTGYGQAEEASARAAKLRQAVAVHDDLAAAVDHLLSQGKPSRGVPAGQPDSSRPPNSKSRHA